MRRYGLILLALVVAGCETDPPAPELPATVLLPGAGLRADAHGEIRSVHLPYALVIKKLDHGDRSLSDLSEHGLPVMVVFANLSEQPVAFGPENIVVRGVGERGEIGVLSANDITKIKEEEKSSNNSSSFLDALFAVAGTAQAGQLMHSGMLNQEQATAVAQGFTTFAVSDIADNNAQNDKIEQEEATLVDHYRSVVLEQTMVPPHGETGGMVFLSHAVPSSTLRFEITTGDYSHHFIFLPPDIVARALAQRAARVLDQQAGATPAPPPAAPATAAPDKSL
jgi:hypothetical protein